ncbi:Peptidase M3 [Naganishia albida]|nr:Peptidase M3 [Naganishia albida]
MSATPKSASAFRFASAPNVQQYRQFWKQLLQETRTRLTDLERPRTNSELGSYLDELNKLHPHENEAEIWRDMHPDPQMREEAKEANKAFVDLCSEVFSSAGIASNLSKLEAEVSIVDADSKRFLKTWKEDFRLGGAHLDTESKAEVKRLSREIAECAEQFEDNIRNDPTRLELGVEELVGLPEDYLKNRLIDSSSQKVIITTKYADTSPIQEYCQVQATREKVFRFVCNEAAPANEDVLKRLLCLRHQKAVILGYTNSAELDLQNTMVKTPAEAARFLDEVYDAVKPRAEKEKSAIIDLLKQKEGIEAQPWDMRYGTALLKSHLLSGFDPKVARQYFPVSRVFPALQQLAQRLFELRFEPIEDVDTWHPTVTASAVYDMAGGEKRLIGRIFFDIYPRNGKNDGASAHTARAPIVGEQLAEVILYANMPEQPGACLSYREVQTILHELGHCVHALTAKQRYHKFAGIGTAPMDFVEAPSQMLELWLTDESLLDFAINDRGERIPKSLLRQSVKASEIGRGMTKRNLLAMSKYCLEFHLREPDASVPTTNLVADVYERYNNFSLLPGLSPHLSLGHIAAEDYGSRLYCYLFSEVICHDVFSRFRDAGSLMDKDTAAQYRKTILEKGSSQDPEEFLYEFLGRKYDSKAYMDWLNAGDL